MAATKKKSKLVPKDVDRVDELEELRNVEIEIPPVEEAVPSNEEPTKPSIELSVTDTYVHVYERVTNGGKRVGVLRQGAKVRELSRTHNWVEIVSVDNPDIRGFVRSQSLGQE